MNLLVDDTRPSTTVESNSSTNSQDVSINQYRIGFNTRCRYDVLDPVLSSIEDTACPVGLKQGILTFGNYVICFVAGLAYYRLNTQRGWVQIKQFSMDTKAPRFWTVVVPTATTNYGRLAQKPTDASTGTVGDATKPIIAAANTDTIDASFQGNSPGLLVQDNINQPQFIFLDVNNNNQVTCRITQTYAQWDFQIDTTTFVVSVDNREYVPIGNTMEWWDGILFITSQDTNYIYRSVSGRPLDFVVNVDINGFKGGDATTTSYSVGTGGITCLRAVSSGLFVSAANIACFIITLNTANNAVLNFGEYNFIRTNLFTAGCLSDRAICDVIGDSTFIDVYGLRSFNAIEQQQNEGRNSVFSKTVSSLFAGLVQNANNVSCTVFDNYALYSVNTTYGAVIIVYDTINEVYTSVDTLQTSVGIKQFARIDTTVTELYGITNDDKLIQLYAGPLVDLATVRFMSVCSQDPKIELKQISIRCLLSEFTQDSTVTLTTFVNNRISGDSQTKKITFVPAVPQYNNEPYFSDANSQVENILFSTPNCGQGWKVFNVLSWTGGGRITNVETSTADLTPMNPLLTQGNSK